MEEIAEESRMRIVHGPFETKKQKTDGRTQAHWNAVYQPVSSI